VTNPVHTVIAEFRDAMASAGIAFSGEIIADGSLHRFKPDTDKAGKRNAWYVAHFDDDRPAGAFGSWKEGGGKHTWTAKGLKPLTPEERKRMAADAAERKAARAATERDTQAAAAALAQKMWDDATTAAEHPYLTRKGISGDGLRKGTWIKDWVKPDGSTKRFETPNTLMIKIRNAKGETTSLQGIFAEPVEMGDDLRDKDFVTGGRKRGCWATIGKPTEIDGRTTIGICEGYATGASVHAATGMAVVVAFDAGNLEPVAETCRALMPAARIVILADDDHWTDKPVANPGMTRAREAAAKIAGEVLAPAFADVSEKPTDWNDLARLEGADAVRAQVFGFLIPPRAAAPGEEPPPLDEASADSPFDLALLGDNAGDSRIETAVQFTIKGFDRDNIWVYSNERNMMFCRSLTDWTFSAFLALAPLKFWESRYDTGKTGVTVNGKQAMVDDLIRAAARKGPFNPSVVRGRGAWRDQGRLVYHFGHRLSVDGAMMGVNKIESRYIYEGDTRLPLPADDPLTIEGGLKIIEMSKRFAWTRPASAILLAGWCAIAPIGGALRWRPHTWITGGPGSGKSTVQGEFVDFLMAGTSLYVNGHSTEAGIRQTMRSDSRPLLFDESEQNDQLARARVQNILSLIRQGSTESAAQTVKGGATGNAMNFVMHFCACLASIQVGIEQQADIERITILSLRSKRDSADPARSWEVLRAHLDAFRSDDGLPSRLMRRSLNLLPTTIRNIETFAKAAAQRFGSQREGDQYGAMLAGAWSLMSDELATHADAEQLIAMYDWTEYFEDLELDASRKAINALLQKTIRLPVGEISVAEVVANAAGDLTADAILGEHDAQRVLMRHGMKALRAHVEPVLFFANGHEGLKELLKDTAYAADFRAFVKGFPGANGTTADLLGTTVRGWTIPISKVFVGSRFDRQNARDELDTPRFQRPPRLANDRALAANA
jgi:putative DNA primase/helicase